MSTLSSIYLLSVRLCTLPDVKVKLESYLDLQAGTCSQDQRPEQGEDCQEISQGQVKKKRLTTGS